MVCLLSSEPAHNGAVLFVIVGVISVTVLYFALSYLRKLIERKQIAEQQSAINEDDGSDEVAAITAAISLILETEAKEEGREAPAFRVVSFKRTNNRRIG